MQLSEGPVLEQHHPITESTRYVEDSSHQEYQEEDFLLFLSALEAEPALGLL